MSVQMTYTNATPRGIAGGLYDLSAHMVDSRRYNDAENLRFGTGVVVGDHPGDDVKKPAGSSTAASFEGIVMNGGTTEQSMTGEVYVLKGQTVSVMRYGRIWARVSPDGQPAYGEDAYLVTDGEYKGKLTTKEDTAAKIAIHARFIGGRDNGVAPVELYNQRHDAPAGA